MNGRSTTAPAATGAVVSPARRRFGVCVVLATVFLIFMGAQVKSHNAGLAVPDWPAAYGRLWPSMVGGIFHEHWHRTVATAVGLLTIALAVWTSRRDGRRWVRRLAWFSLAAVVAQGLLGGLTVKQLLPPEVSASHAALGQVCLCLLAWLAYSNSRDWWRLGEARPPRDASRRGLVARRWTGLAVGAIFLQLLLGAWMRHNEAGLAVPFFPFSSAGRLLPEHVDRLVVIHMLHRGFAFVVALVVWRAALAAADAWSDLMAHASLLAALVLVQGGLGALVVWSAKAPLVTSLHVTTGAILLVLAWLLALRCWARDRSPAHWPANLAEAL